jgi:hypothetical protein
LALVGMTSLPMENDFDIAKVRRCKRVDRRTSPIITA